MTLFGRALLLAAAVSAASCSGSSIVVRGEGLDASALPPEIRGDYAVFAQRCSKCHSLTRALNSGISDDGYWALYVARMRRQPASGISPEDERVVLRFLHYYSQELLRSRAATASAIPAPGGKL